MQARSVFSFTVALLASFAGAQWTDVRQIAKGGETTVSTDGTGNVYVTGHLPCTLYKSTDWGQTFAKVQDFSDALGDMFVAARPDGHVNVVYVRSAVNGIGTWYSTDFANTLQQGTNVEGPLDREWLVADPNSGRLFMDFSNGYIGGPKSKGVFLVRSDDDGDTFSEPVQVDREPEGSYAVDPFLARSSTGRLYSMWQVSTDYNTVDGFRLAYSDDQGDTFSAPVTVGTVPKQVAGKPVDTQERWIIASLQAVGPKGVVVVFPAYEQLMVDRSPTTALLLHYTFSTDGGHSFSKPRILLRDEELQGAIRSFRAKGGATLAYSHYIQNLPWMTTDPYGRLHLVFTDNRDGAATVDGKALANWRVRHAVCSTLSAGFGQSEAVSENYAARRPPMDFISCAADAKFLYASWTETPGSSADFPNFGIFTGNLFVGRKPLKP